MILDEGSTNGAALDSVLLGPQSPRAALYGCTTHPSRAAHQNGFSSNSFASNVATSSGVRLSSRIILATFQFVSTGSAESFTEAPATPMAPWSIAARIAHVKAANPDAAVDSAIALRVSWYLDATELLGENCQMRIEGMDATFLLRINHEEAGVEH